MAEFLKKLIEKFLDFFNFGRFITILLPGLLIALTATMFVSQLLFRHGTPQIAVATAQGRIQANQVIEIASPAGAPSETKNDEAGQALFRGQLQEDFGRLSRHAYLVALLAVVLGLMNYELGYRVLMCKRFERADDEILYPYDPSHDAAPAPANKFRLSRGRLIGLDRYDLRGKSVGLAYFAPFLKEKFSGEENYFHFLVTEFYRFVEVSVVAPLAVIQSTAIGVAYCWLFWGRHHAGFNPVVVMMLALLSVALSSLFLVQVSTKIVTAYNKASHDLIQGVSDFMSKNLSGKSGG